jgi:hypothetical protein
VAELRHGDGLVRTVSLTDFKPTDALENLRSRNIELNQGFITSVEAEHRAHSLSQAETLIELRLGDLGFKKGSLRTSEIMSRMAELGLVPCSYTAIAQLGLTRLDFQGRLAFNAVMPKDEKIDEVYGDQGVRVCSLEPGNSGNIFKHDPGPNYFWKSSDVFLFSVPTTT